MEYTTENAAKKLMGMFGFVNVAYTPADGKGRCDFPTFNFYLTDAQKNSCHYNQNAHYGAKWKQSADGSLEAYGSVDSITMDLKLMFS